MMTSEICRRVRISEIAMVSKSIWGFGNLECLAMGGRAMEAIGGHNNWQWVETIIAVRYPLLFTSCHLLGPTALLWQRAKQSVV